MPEAINLTNVNIPVHTRLGHEQSGKSQTRSHQTEWQEVEANYTTARKPNCPAGGASVAALPRLLRSCLRPHRAVRLQRRWRQRQIGAVVRTREPSVE